MNPNWNQQSEQYKANHRRVVKLQNTIFDISTADLNKLLLLHQTELKNNTCVSVYVAKEFIRIITKELSQRLDHNKRG